MHSLAECPTTTGCSLNASRAECGSRGPCGLPRRSRPAPRFAEGGREAESARLGGGAGGQRLAIGIDRAGVLGLDPDDLGRPHFPRFRDKAFLTSAQERFLKQGLDMARVVWRRMVGRACTEPPAAAGCRGCSHDRPLPGTASNPSGSSRTAWLVAVGGEVVAVLYVEARVARRVALDQAIEGVVAILGDRGSPRPRRGRYRSRRSCGLSGAGRRLRRRRARRKCDVAHEGGRTVAAAQPVRRGRLRRQLDHGKRRTPGFPGP